MKKVHHYIANLTIGGGTKYILDIMKTKNEYEHYLIYRNLDQNYPILEISNKFTNVNVLKKQHLRNDAIHHFHGYNFYREILTCRLLNPSAKIILQLHGYIPSEQKSGIKRVLCRFTEKLCCILSSRVIYLTDSERERNQYKNKKCHIVVTGIAGPKFQVMLSDEKVPIKFVSLGVKNVFQKGIDRLFLLSHRMNSEGVYNELILYFRGASKADREAVELLKHVFSAARCQIRDPSPKVWEEVACGKFHGLISLSRFEGLPISLIEAFQANMPIYISKSSGHEIFLEKLGANEVSLEQLLGIKPPNLKISQCSRESKNYETEQSIFSQEKMITHLLSIYRAC